MALYVYSLWYLNLTAHTKHITRAKNTTHATHRACVVSERCAECCTALLPATTTQPMSTAHREMSYAPHRVICDVHALPTSQPMSTAHREMSHAARASPCDMRLYMHPQEATSAWLAQAVNAAQQI